MEKKYLVYREYNGKITAEIQYGEHSTLEKELGKTLKRVELLDHNNYSLEIWMKMYPYERKSDV